MAIDLLKYDENNIFARILRGELPSKRCYEDEYVLAFHDVNPQARHHILVIPKGAYMSAQDFYAHASKEEIMAFHQAIPKITAELGLDKTGFRIISNHGGHSHQEVPHMHTHILGGEDLHGLLG